MSEPRTLAIDIGGTGIKMLVLDSDGRATNERTRVKTPRQAGPTRTFEVMSRMIAKQPAFDRVSVGFPGVVIDGVASTAPNLGTALWVGTDVRAAVEAISGKPSRVMNDADIAGYGVVHGRGVEMLVTLGDRHGLGPVHGRSARSEPRARPSSVSQGR